MRCGVPDVLPALVDKDDAPCEDCYYHNVARARLGGPRHWLILHDRFRDHASLCAYSGETFDQWAVQVQARLAA